MKLTIGQVVSGIYWTKGFDRRGYCTPIKSKPFSDGVVIGFTKAGGPIISIRSGNLRYNVYRTKVDN